MLRAMWWGGRGLLVLAVMAVVGVSIAATSATPPQGGESISLTTQAPTVKPPRYRLITGGLARIPAPATPPPVQPSCIDLLAPVDKTRSLAPGCVPPDLVALPWDVTYLLEDPVLYLRQEAAASFVEMVQAAEGNGLYIVARSAYRSYQHQAEVFAYWVSLFGIAEAERTSARAGHSEHQLGTAVDVTSYANGYGFEGFDETAEGEWVARYAYLFGFIVSYPEGKEDRTGYAYEPWHLRYIGRANAAAVVASGLTLREYLVR